MNQEDCGCGNNNNLSILNSQPMRNNNKLMHNQLNNQNMNNQNMNNQNINNQNMNNQNMNNQVNNQSMNNQSQERETKTENNKREINLFLMLLAALSINEAVKYFINKSIRLNSGTSSRYIYYALVCVGLAILYNIL